jgi:hypothetical protein
MQKGSLPAALNSSAPTEDPHLGSSPPKGGGNLALTVDLGGAWHQAGPSLPRAATGHGCTLYPLIAGDIKAARFVCPCSFG